jgi:hypothetical protein
MLYSLKIRGGWEKFRLNLKFARLRVQYSPPNKIPVVVGNGNGEIYVFNWGEFGKHSDIPVPGKGSAININFTLTEKVAITGGDDGVLRIVNFSLKGT